MRLPNGFGSVYKLSGKRRNPWVARKTTGWTFDEDKGKSYPVYTFIGYYPNRSEALNALSDYNRDPFDLQTSKMTFSELFDKWSNKHFPTISKSNRKAFIASFNTASSLHDMRVVDIKLDHLQKVVDESGKNTPTLKKLKTMINLMWEYAVIHEIISNDRKEQIKYLDISKAGNPNTIDRSPFTKDQIEQLWNVKSKDEYVGVILIMVYTGVRIGELFNLRKEDVHLEERWFYVKQSKTKAGIREVPIAEKIVPFVEYWMQKDSEYLICTRSGSYFGYKNFYDWYWNPIMNKLGCGSHRPHDTRHTCISMLTEAGVDDRVIKQIVGHKGHGVTESVYTHLGLQIKLEAINKI